MLAAICSSRSNLGTRSSRSIGACGALVAGVPVTHTIFNLFPWGPPLFNFVLGPSDSGVDLVPYLIDSRSTIQLRLDDLVGLEESLKLRRKLVVLVGNQTHVFVESIDLALSFV
jgi:hypothetical protein